MSIASLAKHRVVIALAAILTVTISFYIYVVDASSRALIDFDVYLQAARALAEGEDIYQSPFTMTDRWGRSIQLYYLYPPLLAHILSLFASLSDASLKLGWCLINFALMLVTTITLSKLMEDSWWKSISFGVRTLIIGFFVLCFEPLYVGNGDGQVTAIVLALLVLATLAGARRYDLSGGALLALAIQIKMSPALLLLAPILFKRWRVVGSCLGTSLLLVLFTIVFGGGLKPFLDFASSLTQTVDDSVFQGHVFNFDLNRALLIPLGLSELPLARWLMKGFLISFAVAGTMAIRSQGGNAYLRSHGFLITCMIITSPIIWFHHLAWMLLPLTVLAMRPSQNKEERLKFLTITLGLYFALSQTYLLTIWLRKLAPSLMPASTLIPVALLLVVSIAICQQKKP